MDEAELRQRHGLPLIWDVLDSHLDDVGKCLDHVRVSAAWADRKGLEYHWQQVREAWMRADVVRKAVLQASAARPPAPEGRP